MTRELLQTANILNHGIMELENQLKIVESMLHEGDELQLLCPDIGTITLSPEARLDVLNTALGDINERKEEMEDRLRML